MQKRAERIFLNYSEAKKWYVPTGEMFRRSDVNDYVVITTNAIETSSTKLTEFMNYLTSKGYSPLVITEDDYGSLTGQPPDGTAE